MEVIPYCGVPPVPATLALRWNLDPVLIVALLGLAALHLGSISRGRWRAGAGWAIAALALLSPLCALSVALFSARVGQHMVLVLIAAPLIGGAMPQGRWRHSVWWSVVMFTLALWTWHMPEPYEATFRSDLVYWSMHVTLFGTAIWLWRDLLDPDPRRALRLIAAGSTASILMSLLGAALALSRHALFPWHYFTTAAWGLSPLADQQLGGVLMWVPGCILFLAAALRSLLMLWSALERQAA